MSMANSLTPGAAKTGGASVSAADPRLIKILLHTPLSGPVSFLLLAEDRGYLREHGLSVAFTEGKGAAGIVPQVRSPTFDAGYGDMTALIEVIANSAPNQGPVAIYTTFNSVPFTVAVPADGPVREPKDLEGGALSGYSVDAALLTFDMFARATGIDASTVEIIRSPETMGVQVRDMLNGNGVRGVFGFVNTIVAMAAEFGIDGRKDLRFLTYAHYLPDMYGNGLFVTRELYERDKPGLKGMVHAFNRALRDTVRDPDVAIDALMRRAPAAMREVDRTRLVGTMRSDMGNVEGARIGVGDMDNARLARMIDLVVSAKKLPRTPSVGEVFDRSFLPPDEERIRDMAEQSWQ